MGDQKMETDRFFTDWIWTTDWTAEDNDRARVVYFRKEAEIGDGGVPASHEIRITADSRYKLYVNGSFVREGPQKALDRREWFVDTAEIAPFLREGSNTVAVEVLRFPAASLSAFEVKSNDSLYRTEIPHLYVEDLENETAGETGEKQKLVLRGKSGWKCFVNRQIRIFGEGGGAGIQAQEETEGLPKLAGWKQSGFDDSAWTDARPKMILELPFADAPGNLTPSTIPPQRHEERSFDGVWAVREPGALLMKETPASCGGEIPVEETAGSCGKGLPAEEAAGLCEKGLPAEETAGSCEKGLPAEEAAGSCEKGLLAEGTAGSCGKGVAPEELAAAYERMLHRKGTVEIPPHTVQILELSAGAEECGYLLYSFAGGAGAKVTTLVSECYVYPQPEVVNALGQKSAPMPKKGDRTDCVNGQLVGQESYYTVGGYGTTAQPEEYEPYWFRTFRYVRLKIETAAQALSLLKFGYRSTGYPLEVKTRFELPDPEYGAIWDISVRTLERCMHETYMDCPYYEQYQYAMDSRSEILFTYCISADDRLARQAMEAFRRSARPDGMTAACAPSANGGVIPGFAIYYLAMVHDHMMYFGDKALVRRHFPAIEGILDFFENRLESSGIVGKVGGQLFQHHYWSFIDWSPQWDGYSGTSPAGLQGSGALTMESLLYVYGLQKAAELAEFIGRKEQAAEYRGRAERLKKAIAGTCMGKVTDASGREHSLLQDGPGVELYSVHCQAFAVLTGIMDSEWGRDALAATVGNPDCAQPSVAFMYYLFRAMELCGMYDRTDGLWELWRQMLRDNMTTCAENGTDQRSDCHAWGSLMCHEIPAAVLGVRPAAPGYDKVKIVPHMGKFTEARGDVITPKGFVHVEWKKQPDGSCDLRYELPEGLEVSE